MAWNGRTILNALADGPRLTRKIAAALGKPSRDVTGCLGALRDRGFITTVEGVHEITQAGRAALATRREIISGPCNGSAMSRQGQTLRAKAWRFIRMRDGFSLDDVLSTLCDGGEPYAADNLRNYLSALEAAGYLQRLPRRGEAGQRRFRLKRDKDTGPEAPAWNKATRILRDHNTSEEFAIPKQSKEAIHA